MRRYETFATTADTGIRCAGRDFRELYGNALRGLSLLLFGANLRPLRSPSACRAVSFAYRGDGPENVLVNLLAAALDHVYRDRQRPVSAVFRRAGRTAVDARLLLAPCRRPPRLEVKAVTYHNLRVERRNGLLCAAVVMDI